MAQNKPAKDLIMTEWELYVCPPVVAALKRNDELKQTTITSFSREKKTK